VKFLTITNIDDLLFLTCDLNVCALWSLKSYSNIELRHFERKSANEESHVLPCEFTSVYYTPKYANKFWTSTWIKSSKSSTLDEWELDMKQMDFRLRSTIEIKSKFPIKASILGAGSRFAVVTCAIARENILLIDTAHQHVVASIWIPDVCR